MLAAVKGIVQGDTVPADVACISWYSGPIVIWGYLCYYFGVHTKMKRSDSL